MLLLADVVYYKEVGYCIRIRVHNYAKQLLQSLESLIKTLVDLCDSNTKIIMSYEERNTGNKLEIKRKFFQVSLHHVTMRLCLPPIYTCIHTGLDHG